MTDQDSPIERPRLRFPAMAALVFGAVTVLFFADVLFSNTNVLSAPGLDVTSYLLGARTYGFEAIAHGRLPAWNPHQFSGTPFLADVQTALFYPPNWIYLLLPAVVATNASIALHFFLAAWFTSLWAHARTRSALPSLLAGLIYACSGGYFLHLHPGHLTILCAGAWPPLLLWCADTYLQAQPPRARVRWAALGGLAVGMPLLAGHPQIGYYAAIAAALYTLAHLNRAPQKWAAIVTLGGTMALGAGIAAIQVLPSYALTTASVRQAGLSREMGQSYALPPEGLLSTALPHLFGSAGRNDYVGRWFAWETSVFVGVVTMTLAAYAVATEARARRTAAVIVVLVLMSGMSATVQGWLWRWMPGYALFRAAGRFGMMVDLLLAVLAADGLAGLIRRPAGPPRWLIALAAVGTIAAGAAIAVIRAPDIWLRALTALRDTGQCFLPPDVQTTPSVVAYSRNLAVAQLAGAAGLFLLTAAVLAVWRSHPRLRTTCAALLVATAAGELLWAARTDRSAGPADVPYPPAWAAALPSDPDARVLTANVTYANAGTSWGFLDAAGYNPTVLARYARFLAILQEQNAASDINAAPDGDRHSPLFRLLRVHRLFYGGTGGTPAEVATCADALPRFAWVHQHRTLADATGVFALLARQGLDVRDTVLLETPPDPAPADGPEGTVKVLADSPERVDIDATTPVPAVLLMTDAYAPGWRAVDLAGTRRYDLLPADGALRAIPLPAGAHRIRIEYVPPLFAAGAWVSGATAAGVLAALLVACRTPTPRP